MTFTYIACLGWRHSYQWRGRGLVPQWAILLLIGWLRKYSESRNVLIAGISWN